MGGKFPSLFERGFYFVPYPSFGGAGDVVLSTTVTRAFLNLL
jgi:hypothetical protein